VEGVIHEERQVRGDAVGAKGGGSRVEKDYGGWPLVGVVINRAICQKEHVRQHRYATA